MVEENPHYRSVPNLRDILIAAEQPGEVEPSVLEFIKNSPEARGFIKRMKELEKRGEELEKGDWWKQDLE